MGEYVKQVSLKTSCALSQANSLTEQDIAEAYFAMLTHFQEKTGVSLRGSSKIAIDFRSPLGLTEAAKQNVFAQIAQISSGSPLEADTELYEASWDQARETNTLADCLLKIEVKTIAKDTITFKMSGNLGWGDSYFLPDCQMQQNAQGVWKVTNAEQAEIKIS